jgi:MFS family permease
MSEPPVSEETKYGFRKHINLMKDSIFFVITNSKIIWIIGFVVLIQGISKVWFFSYNPYFELVDLPIIYFGWIFFLLNIVGAVSSYFADYISRKFGELGSIILIIVVISMPVFMMGSYVSKLACLLVLMPNIARGYLTPFIGNLLHHYLDSKNRATVISIKSAVNSFGQFLFLVLFGLLFNIYSLPVCLEIMGFITIVGGVIFIITYFKIFKVIEI